MIRASNLGEIGQRKIFNFRSCGNLNVRDYFNCSGGNSRPLRFFEVWRAALFLCGGAVLSGASLHPKKNQNRTARLARSR